MSITSAIRKEFPELDRLVYLNSAALGLIPERGKREMIQALADRELTTEARTSLREGRDAEARAKIGRLINAGADDICLLANTSEGLNIVAQGLDLRAGDNIVLSEKEFCGNIVPWLNLAKKGVVIKKTGQAFGRDPLPGIIEAIDGRTRIVAVSFVGWIDGFKADVAALGRVCRDKGVFLVVDGIQGIGAMDLDVAAANVAFLACGAQKWLMSPNGTGFVYVSKSLLPLIDQKYLGYLSLDNEADNPFDFEIRPRPDAGRFHLGSYNDKGIAVLNQALSLILEAGIGAVRDHILGLNRLAALGLRKKGYEIVSSLEPANVSGILTFRGNNIVEAYGGLIRKGIIVSLRNGWIRISPHLYNIEEDIDRLIAAL